MALSAGTRLGPYEIVAPLGAGGMGEVYRARDTKLDRDVAIKVLPTVLAQHPDRLARFEREAKVLAALNHPNIAMIHGLEDRAIVMELVEGPTLADRIAAGALPLDESLKIAAQIADALEAAHEKGVVHRDLKPANVKVRDDGTAKVLDFGLATAVQSNTTERSDGANSPTLTMGGTEVGVILGTASYMSPEQAAGKPVDRRADIWSFGVVLWEMLTRKRLFEGESVSHTLADVLRAEIDFGKLPASTPGPIRELLKRCLDRDVKTRLRDIGEARIAIQKYLANPASAPDVTTTAPSRPWLGWMAGVLAATLVVLGSLYWRATRLMDRPLQPLLRLRVDLGPNSVRGASSALAFSPDGARVVFRVMGSNGTPQLAVRNLDQEKVTVLSGTENANNPFFSPDGQWVGYQAARKLRKIPIQGGASIALCDYPYAGGASWAEDGTIVLASGSASGLSRVRDSGGAPQALTNPAAHNQRSHRTPQVLPDGRAVLFTAHNDSSGFDEAEIDALDLKTGQWKTVQRGGYYGRYLPSGHLVYVSRGTLFAVRFDPSRLETTGSPVPILGDLAASAGGGDGQFDFTSAPGGAGTFAYTSGTPPDTKTPVVWLDNTGNTQPLVSTPQNYADPALSPDGHLLALSVRGANGGGDIQVWDIQREVRLRLTFGQSNRYVVWAPDGKHLVYDNVNEARVYTTYWIRADGAGEPRKLLQSPLYLAPSSFTPDGRRLAFEQRSLDNNGDLLTLPLDLTDPEKPTPGKPEVFLQTPKSEVTPMFSPDGHWIAYSSDESGSLEIYVRPFRGSEGKWLISIGGGTLPRWSRVGRQLFYATPAGRLMVVDYEIRGDSFLAGKPHPWAENRRLIPGLSQIYDVAPDGKRIAGIVSEEIGPEHVSSVQATFLLNFFDELLRKVPAEK